jgi:cobalt-zinc-cadmium efflux system outer membrane protein
MRLFKLLIFFFVPFSIQAQDTLRLTLSQADDLFLKNNLLLLAEKYRIESTKALEIQEGLWENPNLAVELNAYNSTKSRAFDVGNQGQKIVQLQQMLTTAGKRNKRVALAMENTRMTEYEFYDLLRTLKFQLREPFVESYFLQKSVALLDSQVATLRSTIVAFEREYNRNNVSLKEVIRLKALLFELTNNRSELVYEMADNQRELRELLQVEGIVVPLVDSSLIKKYRIVGLDLQQLQEKALQSRADLRVAQSLTRQSELNHSLQKALAVPDVTVGAIYDQQGSYINNYLGVTFSMDIPFFNRNQGNIKSSKSHIDYQKAYERVKTNTVKNEVQAAVQKVAEAEKSYQSLELQFTEQFGILSKGVYANFQKRNIALQEFTDFIETYNESSKQFNRLQADRIRVYEELNYAVGEELFK